MFISFFSKDNFFLSSNNINRSGKENNFNRKNDKNPFFQNLFNVRWFRIAICFVLFLLFLLLWQQVGQKFTLLMFTVLPLFVGYGLSHLLEPINQFFRRFFSKRVSQIIVFCFFLFFTLSLVLGLFFILFIQLDDLYRKFLFKTGNVEFETFLKDIVKKREGNEIKDFNFVKSSSDSFELSYSTSTDSIISGTGSIKKITVMKNEVAGIFILLLSIASSLPFLKGICFTGIDWIYSNLTNYGYLRSLFANLETIVLFLYLFFFTIVIAAFSLGKTKGFFNKIWYFLTKDHDKNKMEQLKVELRQNLSAWGKGLLIVQLYIFIGSGLFLFVAGIIFSSWSSYDEAAIVLTLFMTFCNLVPYIGPAIGFIPIVSVGLIDVVNEGVNNFGSWAPFIVAFGGCFLVQIGELSLVSPLVYSRQVKLNPIAIIVGLSIFGVLFGVFWMPIAIPTILIIKIIYQTVYEKEDKKTYEKNDEVTISER